MEYILNETQFYGASYFLINIISIISVLLSLYVIISKNPVISILFLIGLFFSVSMYLITIGLHFIGLSYLLVYIGAVSIFFIFIIMLINIRVSELLTDNSNSVALAVLTVLTINYCVVNILPSKLLYDILEVTYNVFNFSGSLELNVINDSSFINIITVTSKSWDNVIISSSHMSSIGSILYTNLYLLLMVTSLILLLSMIGAIVITMGNTK